MTEHPSKSIMGTKGRELENKRIILCVCGSVGAVQSPEVARLLMRHGAEVQAVMSPMAQRILHPDLMEWATGNPVVTELTGKIEHVALVGEHSKRADLVLVAPATANTISKIACGIDDTTVTSVITTAFGSRTPIIIVPAMHESMYNHPILNENIKKLKTMGVGFVQPRLEENKAKIAESEDILSAVMSILVVKQDLKGLRMLITAGPTIEYLDPVRIMTNKSSGKMGAALANEAFLRGAETTVIYGFGKPPRLPPVTTIRAETTDQMYTATISELRSKRYDAVFGVAAVADWKLEKPHDHKISTKETKSLNIQLKPTKKIIDQVRRTNPDIFLVAFRAEYNLSRSALINNAYDRLLRAKADMIIANDVGKKEGGFDAEDNEVFIVDRQKNVTHIPLMAKSEVARKILDTMIKLIKRE